MPKRRQVTAIAAFVMFSALSAAGPAGAGEFNQFIWLGDSTLDTGYFRYNGTGIPSYDALLQEAINNGAQGGWAGNGVVGATILAGKFGLSAAAYGAPGGGTNYANGAGYTDVTSSPFSTSVSTVQQIQNYLASVNNVANPRALYEISSGNNDLLKNKDLTTAAAALATSVEQLQAAGARTILVPNSFLGAVYAGPGGVIPAANQQAYEQAVSYNALRWSNLSQAGVHFIPADLDSVFMHVVRNPYRFGFTPNSVLSNQAPVYNQPSPFNSALLADNLDISQLQQQTYLFIDGHHLTTAGQTIEADYEYSLLVAPSEMSLLAESVVQAGWARVAAIQSQLDPCGQLRESCGRRVWATAGTYSLAVKNAPGFASDNGTPFGGTVGLDYQIADGLIFGAAFTSGSQTPQFSTGGHFSQVDEAPSLYVAYLGQPWWGNAVVSYDLLQDHTTRVVPLGVFTDQNDASFAGQSLAVALRGGRDFNVGTLTTGPVAGLVLQQAHIDGFTESGVSGVTALAFDAQTRQSLVTQLGWRACVGIGSLRPFAEMSWNHECAAKQRTITTSLTSVIAPSYVMDAVPVVSDWATASLGAYYEVSPRVMLRGAASAMFINPQMTTVGGDVSLNIGF